MLDDLRTGCITERWQLPPPEGELMLDSSLFLPFNESLPISPMLLSGPISTTQSAKNSTAHTPRASQGTLAYATKHKEPALQLKGRPTTAHFPQ